MDLMKPQGIYTDEDEEELFSKEIDEIYKVSLGLGNQLRVGFFGQDACVQTDVSELPTVNLLSDHTAELSTEMTNLKKDIVVKVKYIQAQYEARLQQEAELLYTRINDKVKSLEDHHKEKVKVLRKSYQQQFTDAIHVVRASYKKYYLKKGVKVAAVASDTGRLKELQSEIQEKDYKIECMSEQLRDYEERVLTQITSDLEDPEKEWLRTENDRLKDDIDSVHVGLKQVRTALELKERKLDELVKTVRDLKSKAEEDQKAMLKLSTDHEQIRAQFSMEKETDKTKMKALKEEMEKEIKCIEEFRKSEIAASEKEKEERIVEEKERRRTEVMMAQDAVLKAQVAVKAPVVEIGDVELIQELDELKKAETVQKKEIEILQKRLVRSSNISEKKFEIMKRSYHAIKDEMFLRQMLQRQAASLQQVSVCYTRDQPGSFQGPSYNVFKTPRYTPLPNIGGGGGGLRKMDRINETMDISVLSGRGTDALSFPESQLESGDKDDEDDEDDLPLPRPPTTPVSQANSSPLLNGLQHV